jgi:hypothetical protein
MAELKGLNAAFQTSSDLEKKGVWLDLGELNGKEGEVTKILLARSGGMNVEFQRAMEKITRKNLTRYKAKAISTQEMTDMTIPIYAKHVVLDWENVMFNGEYLPYTPENCEIIFRELPDFFDLIAKEAGDFDLFKQANLEVARGN